MEEPPCPPRFLAVIALLLMAGFPLFSAFFLVWGWPIAEEEADLWPVLFFLIAAPCTVVLHYEVTWVIWAAQMETAEEITKITLFRIQRDLQRARRKARGW